MALKTITGLIQGPDGTNKAAVITATLNKPTFITGTNEFVPSLVKTTAAANGTYTFSLQANADMTPADSYYFVTESSPDGGFSEFTIVVPQSAGPFVMSNILAPPPPSGVPAYHVGSLVVDGLITAGSLMVDGYPVNISLTPSGDATGATDSTEINEALATATTVTLQGGTFYINTPILQPSNTLLILWEATVFLVAGSNCNIWRNTNQTVAGDVNVYIQGFGRASFNGNAINQARLAIPKGDGTGINSFLGNTGMSPVSIAGFKAQGIQLGPTNGWGMFLQGVTNFDVDVFMEQDASTTFQDGVDVGLGCSNGRIKIRGKTGDDACGVMAIQWWNTAGAGIDGIHPLYYVGAAPANGMPMAVADITYDIDVNAAYHSLMFFKDDTSTTKNITATQLKNRNPANQDALVGVGDFYANPAHRAVPGSLTGVTIPLLVGHTLSTAISLDGHIDWASFGMVDLQDSSWTGSIIGTGANNFSPTVRDVVLGGVKGISLGSAYVGDVMNFRAGSTVTNLTIANVELKEAQAILNNAATAITGLRLRRIHIGKCYRTPFNSGTPEGSDVVDVVVDSTDVAVTIRGSLKTTRTALKNRVSGNLTLNNAAWTNVDTGLDCTVIAQVGDVLSLVLSAQTGGEAVNAFFDVATIVSAAVVRRVSGSGAGGYGIQSWVGLAGSAWPLGGPYFYTVQKSDIDTTGFVNLRLQYIAAGNKTLYANANNPLQFAVSNLGPAA